PWCGCACGRKHSTGSDPTPERPRRARPPTSPATGRGSGEPLPWSGWAYQGGGSPPRCNRWRSPGPGPRSMPAAASAASGAAAWGYRPRPSGGGGGRSRWDSRSAFPRVSPALYGCGLAFSLVGRRPASGRGLDVYADQTLADALRGVAGRVAYAPGVTLNGWDEPPTRAGSPVPGGTRRPDPTAPRAAGTPAHALPWPCGLLRRRFRRSPSSRGPSGAVGLPRRGLGRPRAAVPGGPARADAVGRRARGGGGGRRLPPGRTDVHLVGDRKSTRLNSSH